MAQSDFMWGLRTHPLVVEAFAHAHNTTSDNVVTSLDSYSLHLRGHPSKTRGEQTGMALALHDDQAQGLGAKSEVCSVQGALNFLSVTPEDTGFVVVPQSHKRWKNRSSGRKGTRHKSHFVPFKKDEPDFATMMASAIKLIIPSNCLVLWNSRTLHGTAPGTRERPWERLPPALPAGAEGGSGGGGGRSEDGSGGDGGGVCVLPVPNRLTCFVAMLPRELRSPSALQDKVELYHSGASTSHWANVGECHFVNSLGVITGRVTGDGSIPAERQALL
mmetsp:Transcript_17293/g.40573  ORF Transcript_17293/g.40573 Transcript_17293/m.40573 type:complete len:275 (-) Transcript_17293:29-853(-)